MQHSPLILASGSAIRASIMKRHGLDFRIIKPGVDESEIKEKAEREGGDLEATAMQLAEAKCLAVAKAHGDFVVGSDQIMEFEGRAFDKPRDMTEAGERLLAMQGKTHSLINATVLARGGEIIWRNLERPRLTVRAMTAGEIDDYLARVGPEVLSSVGAYQVETPEGAALFERISGDWFAVQGLAIYPLLEKLRKEGALGERWVNPAPVQAGVIGMPAAHSLSPFIHNEWASRCHVVGEYRAIEVAPGYDAFAAAMDKLRADGFAGVNVTIPHKENALSYADKLSDAAKEIGAANMLTFSEEGVVADNSDARGFHDGLMQAIDKNSNLDKALVLGAGGAARGVIAGLRLAGCQSILIANRTREKAERLANEFGLNVTDWEERSAALCDCNLLVNTTSLGMSGQAPLDIDLSALPAGAIVYDIVYTPLETPLIKASIARGHRTINGLEMLMHQAAPGFRQWFGKRPFPVFPRVDDDLRDLLISELKKRGTL